MNGLNSIISIGLVGDHSDEVAAHGAIPKALELAGQVVGCRVETEWLPTQTMEKADAKELARFDAMWCVPGSPYASMDGAVNAIRIAREEASPFLGTCGGFQHAVIEYARNVLGFREADHAESNPNATVAFVTKLSCSLANGAGKIRVLPGTQAFAIFGQAEIAERYNCNFGVNPEYQMALERGGLRIAGVDADGGVRIVEIPGHPFFIATLFQPELSASSGLAHPLVVALVKATARSKKNILASKAGSA